MSSESADGTFRFRFLVSMILMALSLLAGGSAMAYFISLREPASLREPVPRHYNVEVFRADRINLQEIILAFGTVEADKEVAISAQVAGEIVEIHPQLKVGTLVSPPDVTSVPGSPSVHEAGDRLLVIDPRTYEERVIQVEGRIAEARTELSSLDLEEKNLERLRLQFEKDLADLEKEFRKIQELVERKITTDSELRRATLERRVVETQLVQNRNQIDLIPARREQVVRRIATLNNDLEVARHDLAHTTIRPPFRGRLSSVTVEQGQFVRPGDTLVTLTDASQVEIPLSVSLADYAKIVPFVLEGRFPDVALAENETAKPLWHGQLVRVAPQADERTRTVQVFVHVDNLKQETPLLPGMFVHARIDGPKLSDIQIVPRDAVLKERGFVIKDGKAIRRDVQVKRTLGAFAMIEQGFETGDEVILSNLDVLYDGAPVTASVVRTLAEEISRRASTAIKPLP